MSWQEEALSSDKPYLNAVGSIMYEMTCTRLDLAHGISCFSICMANPGKIHWFAIKFMLSYLSYIASTWLMYSHQNSDEVTVEGFVDSDYADDRDTRRYTFAYVFAVCGSCVSWRSQIQPVVTLSTFEVEYITATMPRAASGDSGRARICSQRSKFVGGDSGGATIFFTKNLSFKNSRAHWPTLGLCCLRPCVQT